MYTDVNALLGHWPFRKIRKPTLEDLRSVHRANGISNGYVASLNSIFYNDPFEGDAELHAILAGTEYKHVLTVNPVLPGWERDIDEGLRRFNIRGVRIYPTYHDYRLDNESVNRLCSALKERGLPLFLTKRLEDERLEYVLKTPALPVDELKQFVTVHADQDIVILNLRYAEALVMKNELNELPRLYFDTSGLKDRVFVLQDLLEHVPAGKILYGSEHPLYCLKSTHCLVDMVDIDESVKKGIFQDHARFLER